MTEVTTSHDPLDWREAFETTEHGPELDRIRGRVAGAVNRGTQDAIVAVVLDEASRGACRWRKRAIEAEERAEELSRIAAGLTEREAAATREVERLRERLALLDPHQPAPPSSGLIDEWECCASGSCEVCRGSVR